jgi:hypothetical protein
MPLLVEILQFSLRFMQLLGINYNGKSFITLGPGVDAINIFDACNQESLA